MQKLISKNNMLSLLIILLATVQGYSQCSPSNSFPCKTCSADYGLTWNASNGQFDVYMNSSVFYDDVKLSTAQVTIVVPDGYMWTPGNLNNDLSISNNVGTWDANTLNENPSEDPANDYLSIGLSSFNSLTDFPPNTPVLLFSFSFNGACPPGNLSLIENSSPLGGNPNSTGSSLANQINIDDTNTFPSFCDDYKANYYGPSVSCLNALPLELLSFKGRLLSNMEVLLDWTTANESDVSHFEVYHSIDGINFSPIGMKEGRGTGSGNLNYELIHKRPVRGINYYKLKTIEIDGTKSYSHIVEITIKNDLGGIILFPNPTYDKITLQLPAFIGFNDKADLHVQIYDVLHHKLREFIFTEINNEMIDIDMSDLIPGSYIVRVTHGSNVFNEIVVVDDQP